jgi:phospholipid transport system substrate-binding protein
MLFPPRFTRRGALRVALITGVLPWAVSAAAQAPALEDTPDGLVRKVSTEILEAAKADKAVRSGDLKKINGLVNEKVMPHVNFPLMTRRTIGPQWNRATAAQQQRLQDEFRVLLVRTYSGALSLVQDQVIQVEPVSNVSDTDNVIVKSKIRGKGKPIPIDYRLEKSTGAWKFWDLNVEGLWLVTAYQGQFKPILSNEGIDGVIKHLTELNKAAANRNN